MRWRASGEAVACSRASMKASAGTATTHAVSRALCFLRAASRTNPIAASSNTGVDHAWCPAEKSPLTHQK